MSNLQPVRDLDYEERAASDDLEVIQLVGLKLGDEEYAIDVLKIQEIIRTVEITSVPRTDSFVLGVMNLRGKVIPVIDLRVRFSLDKMDFDKETRIIVVKFETQNIGFVVDEVTEVIRINRKMVEPTPPLVGSIGQEYILGICKYQERLIILLDIDSVINDGKIIEDSNLKKSLLGQAALPSAETNYNNIAAAVEKEFDEKDEAPMESSDEPAAIATDAPSSGGDESIDDLIALELAKREQETDELNSKKKEESSKKKSEIDEDSLDDILNDALNQSENNMNTDAGHVEQDELDFLISQELAKREQETDELNKKKKVTETIQQAPEPEPVPPLVSEEDMIEQMMASQMEEEKPSEEIKSEEPQFDIPDDLAAEFGLEDVKSEAPASEAQMDFHVPSDLAAEFGLDDVKPETPATEAQMDFAVPSDLAAEFGLADEPTQEDVKDELYTLPEPIENELGDEIIGSGMADDFEMPSPEEAEAEPVATLAEEQDIDDIITPEFIQEMKAVDKTPPLTEQETFEKLKSLSKKIIDGEKVDLGVSIKKEVSELLKLISDTKYRVDEIEPTLITSKEQLPNVVKSLETVTESTENATMNLMEAADGLSGQYQDFLTEMDDLEDLIYKKDKAAILKKLDSLEDSAAQADAVGMGILHALEFQDITEQKLNKVIGAVQEVGARLGAILGFIRLKQETDPSTVEDASQDDIDKLLAEFGLN